MKSIVKALTELVTGKGRTRTVLFYLESEGKFLHFQIEFQIEDRLICRSSAVMHVA